MSRLRPGWRTGSAARRSPRQGATGCSSAVVSAVDDCRGCSCVHCGGGLVHMGARSCGGCGEGAAVCIAGAGWCTWAHARVGVRCRGFSCVHCGGRLVHMTARSRQGRAVGRAGRNESAREHQRALDLLDRLGDLDAARAGLGAVERGAAAPHAVDLVEDVEALGGAPRRG